MAQTFHKFKAESLDQAYRAMRRKLGEDALVVRTATVTEGGLKGFMGRKMIEVTASAPASRDGAEERQISAAERRYLASAGNPVQPGGLFGKGGAQTAESIQETVAYFQRLVKEAQQRMSESALSESLARHTKRIKKETKNVAVDPDDSLRKDINEMRGMLEILVAEAPEDGVPQEFVPYYRMLLDKGVTREVSAGLVARASKCEDGRILEDADVAIERFKMEIRRGIRVSGGIGLTAGETRVIALVGPTGVGKTTNLAKLAAQFAVSEQAKVGLITADTYRVAATDQLGVYASIIGVEMKVVKTPEDMAAAMRHYEGYDLVLIDTAGGSPFNQEQMENVRELLRAAQPDESMLLLSASTPLEDMRTIVGRFSYLQPGSILFTKLDETRRYGPLLCMAVEAGLPLSYFSIGQNVPDDVVLAKTGMVADMVMESGEKRGTTSSKTA